MAQFVKEAEFSISGPEPDVGAVAWSPDGSQIATLATLLRRATVFAVPTGQVTGTISDLASGSHTIDFAADGSILIPTHHADAGALTLWNPRTGSRFAVPGPDPQSGQILTNLLFNFALDASRKRLAGLHNALQGDKKTFHIAVYDTSTWRLLADHAVSATGLALSPDGKLIAAVRANGQVNVFDALKGTILLTFQANVNGIRKIAWSPDGRRIVTGAATSDGYGLDVKTGKYGKLHDDQVLQSWDAATGQLIAVARQDFGGGVEWLEFSGDGKSLVTTTADGTCRIWDPANLELRQLVAEGLHPTTALARFSPDSRRLAVIRTGLARAAIFRAK